MSRNSGDEELKMKKLLSSGVVPLSLAMATLSGSTLSSSQDRDVDEGIRDRFIGAWRLVWLEEPVQMGNVHRADCTGMLVFTREGRMSVQVMYRNPQAGSSLRAGAVRAGRIRGHVRPVRDRRARRAFTYHVEGALVRSLVGKDLAAPVRAVRQIS